MLTHCTYGAHSQQNTPAAIWEGYSHTSPPQSCGKQPNRHLLNAITSGARNSRVPLARI